MAIEQSQRKFAQISPQLKNIVELQKQMERARGRRKRDLEASIAKAAPDVVSVDASLARLYLKAIDSSAESSITEAWARQIQASPTVDVSPIWSALELDPTLPDLAVFPPGSWVIQFKFQLRKPYISTDDTEFYVIDNPVKKEWIFKQPYVAASQWKGTIRSGMIQNLADELQEHKDGDRFFKERLQQYRLFGNEKDGTAQFLNKALAVQRIGPRPEEEADRPAWNKKLAAETQLIDEQFEALLHDKGYRVGNIEGYQGHLYFYATTFDRVGVELINPHERDSNAGSKPIQFECVPAGAEGQFAMLYLPLDLKKTSNQVSMGAGDLLAMAYGIQKTFTMYGFGAKTSSGYGVAHEKIPNNEGGVIRFRLDQDTNPVLTLNFPSFGLLPKAAGAS